MSSDKSHQVIKVGEVRIVKEVMAGDILPILTMFIIEKGTQAEGVEPAEWLSLNLDHSSCQSIEILYFPESWITLFHKKTIAIF